jgi:hypothetical protein
LYLNTRSSGISIHHLEKSGRECDAHVYAADLLAVGFNLNRDIDIPAGSRPCFRRGKTDVDDLALGQHRRDHSTSRYQDRHNQQQILKSYMHSPDTLLSWHLDGD